MTNSRKYGQQKNYLPRGNLETTCEIIICFFTFVARREKSVPTGANKNELGKKQ